MSEIAGFAAPDFLRLICTPGGTRAWARIRQERPFAHGAELDRVTKVYSAAQNVRRLP